MMLEFRRVACAVTGGLALVLVSCAGGAARPAAPAYPDLPPFGGEETDRWLAQESEPIGRDDVLPAFEASAQNYGCRTSQLGAGTTQNIYGEMRSYYGVTAACYEGTISIITLAGGGVRIGCAKPTTLSACNQLLRDISAAR